MQCRSLKTADGRLQGTSGANECQWKNGGASMDGVQNKKDDSIRYSGLDFKSSLVGQNLDESCAKNREVCLAAQRLEGLNAGVEVLLGTQVRVTSDRTLGACQGYCRFGIEERRGWVRWCWDRGSRLPRPDPLLPIETHHGHHAVHCIQCLTRCPSGPCHQDGPGRRPGPGPAPPDAWSRVGSRSWTRPRWPSALDCAGPALPAAAPGAAC